MSHMTVQVNAGGQVLRKRYFFLLRTGYLGNWYVSAFSTSSWQSVQVPQDRDVDTLYRV